jgi:RHS repeat-associated protein
VWNNATNPKYGATFGSAGGLWTSATTKLASREKVRDGFGAVTGSNFTANTKWTEQVLRGPTGRIVSTRINSPTFGVRVESHQHDALSRLRRSKVDHNSTRLFAAADISAAANNETFDPIISADASVTHDHGAADTLKATSPDVFGREFNAVYDTVTPGLPPTSVNGLAISRDGRERISYDKQLTYTFDALDRLVLVRRGVADELRLAYDGLGRRRLERRGKTGAVDTDVVLEYDGPNVIQETAAATGAIQFSTMHAPAIDAPMATWFGQLTPTTKTYDLGTNARGDVTVVAKAGSLSEEQLLDPYGEREAKVGSNATCVEGKEAGTASLPVQKCTTLTILQRFGIGGARQHPATKLVDLRNRVYATHLRGFLTKDPMGSIDSDGLYNYVAGDPVNLRDPWGLAVTESLENELNLVNTGGNSWETRSATCDDKCERKENARVVREAEQSGVFDDDPPAPRDPRRQPTRREEYERAQGRVPTRPWQQGMVPVIGPARDFGEDMERSLVAIEHDRFGDAWSFGLLSFASGLFAVIDGLSFGVGSALAGAARAEARNIVRAEITAAARAELRSPIDILRPGGVTIGQPGDNRDVRIVDGDINDGRAMFDEIAKSGAPLEGTTYPGTLVKVEGGTVGFRETSTSGPPTLDVRIQGVKTREVKFIPSGGQ